MPDLPCRLPDLPGPDLPDLPGPDLPERRVLAALADCHRIVVHGIARRDRSARASGQ